MIGYFNNMRRINEEYITMYECWNIDFGLETFIMINHEQAHKIKEWIFEWMFQ